LIPVAVAFGMPYSFLLAVALVYGRMASDREITALRISGIPPRVIAAPVLGLGAVLALVAFLFYGWVLPDAAQAVRIQSRNLVDLFLGQLGGSERTIALRRFRFSFADYEPAGRPGGVGVFRDFELDLRARDGTLINKVFGGEARLSRRDDELVIYTPEANIIAEAPGGKASVTRGRVEQNVGHVERLGLAAQFNDVVGHEGFEAKSRDVAWPDLAYFIVRGNTPRVPLKRSAVEFHMRLAAACSPFVFGLIAVAVSLQLTSRSRRLTGFLLAFLPVLLLHLPLLVAGKSMADGGRVAPWIGVWAANLVVATLGLGLLWRAGRR
jgi:hypothetical protein